MKISSVVLGFVLASPSWSLCPMGKRALEDAESFNGLFEKRDSLKEPKEPKEKRQTGPGGLPFTTFNENQKVDVTGAHRWIAPGPGDLRGPCPGLNALANHGYFPRNGVVPLTVGATATNEVYGEYFENHLVFTVSDLLIGLGLALNFGFPLTVFATLVDGDVVWVSNPIEISMRTDKC